MGADRTAQRRRAVVGRLPELGVDAMVVSHLPNVRYLTGFTGTAGLALISQGGSVLVTDSRYSTQAETEVAGDVRVDITASDAWDRLHQVVSTWPEVTALGFEAHVVTAAAAERIDRRVKKGGRPRFVPLTDVVEGLRAVKEPGEVAAIRAAARVAADAFAATLEVIRPGVREVDVAARLESELRRRGSEWHPFPTIAASGPRSALPHARTTTRVVGAGEWLLLDFGAQVDGYCADLTRTVVVGGRADGRQRAVYELVREAQRRAIEGARAGMTGAEIDGLARQVIEVKGFGDAFGHSLGHGLGLEVHEAPRLSRLNDRPIPAGAVVTMEPGAYFPGWGGVRLEDDVLLSADGVELLSDGDTELRELL